MKRLLTLAGLGLLAASAAAQPSAGSAADTARLRRHIVALTSTPEPRNYLHLASLNQAADYIKAELTAAGARPAEQTYTVQGRVYRNILGSFGPAEGPRLILGAHYDVFGEQPGADDNGSGVAALLEVAHLLGQQAALPYRVDVVAYTLEEPPFFRTKNMGSYVHAQALHEAGVAVRGMVALETLGYFDDQKHTQDYPQSPLKWLYGNRGNYVTVAQKFGNGRFGRQFARRYRGAAALPVKRFKAPAWLPGIDFSDHLNYWHFGYPAVLLTDTAFYRNKHYHRRSDTLDRLDMRRLGLAVDALLAVVLQP
ncbi:M28 family peptidase [Hymenobacter sp. BT18]|uniref:M28 family peptidase n=1 Tax=Hymenobacter sp. BT18 TaxID=2835648 RepID=UPI00143E8A0A|nr:M28 family peptidase [Hymenobacter sp. BT18]QIX63252.1 M28 family peptidase [Hymenobacter sp. BT18]